MSLILLLSQSKEMLEHQERWSLWCAGETEAVFPFKIHQGIQHRMFALGKQGNCHWGGIWQEITLSVRVGSMGPYSNQPDEIPWVSGKDPHHCTLCLPILVSRCFERFSRENLSHICSYISCRCRGHCTDQGQFQPLLQLLLKFKMLPSSLFWTEHSMN